VAGYDEAVLLESTEAWFVRRGLPYFIEDRKATDDVFTRAFPLLPVYFAGNLMVVLSLHLTALERVGIGAAGAALLALVYMLANLLRGERFWSLPSRIGWFEIAAFVLIPPAVDFGVHRRPSHALADLAGDVGVVLVIYLVTSAVFPLAQWAFRRTFQELGEVFDLAARGLPLLFLFNSFLFISGDVWEFAGGETMSPQRLWGIVALFAVFTVLFLIYRLPDEVRKVAAHDDRSTVVEACQGTPIEPAAGEVELHAGKLPLSRAQRVNVLMVLFVGQILQVMLLGVLVFLFFIGFGKAALSPKLIDDWTRQSDTFDDPSKLFGQPLQHYIGFGIDARLWHVALFLAAVSAFFFAISSLNDEAYKAQFHERMSRELETAIQVRRVYLALYEGRYAMEPSQSGSHIIHIPAPVKREAHVAMEHIESHFEDGHQAAHSKRHASTEATAD
jgi:hypothetical protein